MKTEKNTEKGLQEKKIPEGAKFYPDIEFNKKERRKTLILSLILVVMMGGMGVTLFFGSKNYKENDMTVFIMGALMIFVLVFAISTIPNGFKQYPVKDEPIIEVKPKEITINGETYKTGDVLEVRLTIALDSVGKKEENEKYLDSLLAKEPEKGMTANVDVAVRDKGGKSKTLYTTVKNAYEALVAFYKAGVKRYSIVYSMKKLVKKSTFDLGEFRGEDGVKLSQVSKKDRLKQLY